MNFSFQIETMTDVNIPFLFQKSVALSSYRDRQFRVREFLSSVHHSNHFIAFQGNEGDQDKKLLQSTTLYVGNLSFYTTEEQIHELFSRAGDVKRIIMGLDKTTKTPCKSSFENFLVLLNRLI